MTIGLIFGVFLVVLNLVLMFASGIRRTDLTIGANMVGLTCGVALVALEVTK
jgi:hypothetical protein